MYEEEPISIFAIFDKEKLMKLLKDKKQSKSDQIEISMINTLTHEKQCVSVGIDLSNLDIHMDSVCFSLAAKHHIDYLESKSKADDIIMLGESEASSTSLSLKYKVL